MPRSCEEEYIPACPAPRQPITARCSMTSGSAQRPLPAGPSGNGGAAARARGPPGPRAATTRLLGAPVTRSSRGTAVSPCPQERFHHTATLTSTEACSCAASGHAGALRGAGVPGTGCAETAGSPRPPQRRCRSRPPLPRVCATAAAHRGARCAWESPGHAVLFADHRWSVSSHWSTRLDRDELGCCLLFLLYFWLWAQPNFTCMNLQTLGKR